MGLIKDNKELDSTIAVVCVFIAFMGIISAILTFAFKALPIPDEVLQVFQSCKELALMVLSYFFTKKVVGGDATVKPEDKHE